MNRSGTTRHVLLMLSGRKPPRPLAEIDFHMAHVRQHGVTYVATRARDMGNLRDLMEGKSKVAFFGDKKNLRHRYFGQGIFLEFIDNPRQAQDVLRLLAIYERCWEEYDRCIKIKEFTAAISGQIIASLDGVMLDGVPLTSENLFGRGQRNAEIYFHDR